jgi:hypothetical protein
MLAREILERVREIQVRTGRHVADVLAGEYVSVFKGRGMEFDEVRPYIPGDDVRTIDWNVTARMGEPYVKRYVEERQLNLMLMADVSASQDFGSASRSERVRSTRSESCARCSPMGSTRRKAPSQKCPSAGVSSAVHGDAPGVPGTRRASHRRWSS